MINLDFSVYNSCYFSIPSVDVAVAMVSNLPRLVMLMWVFFLCVSCFRVSQGTQCLLLHLSLMELLHPHWKRGKWVSIKPPFPHPYPSLAVTLSPERYGSAQCGKI